MGKTKKKNKRQIDTPKNANVIMNHEKVRHLRYQQGGIAVIEEIKRYSEDDIILKSYVKTDDPHGKKLTRMYDQMLLHARTEPSMYLDKRTDIIGQIGTYIHEQNLYRIWIDLILIVSANIHVDRILHAYMNEMMDTWRELSYRYPGKLICGLSSDDQELMFVPDHFGDWDIPALKVKEMIQRKLVSEEKGIQLLAEHAKLDELAKNENLWTIELFDMLPFINERTYKLIPPSPPENYSFPTWSVPDKWRGTKIYQDAISRRKYMIGRKGLRVKFRNAKSVDELYIMEDIDRNNELVMLYQLNIHNHGGFTGYYRVKQRSFYSSYLRTSHPTLHQEIMNFVLGVYSNIISELDQNRRSSYRLEEVSDLENIENYLHTRIYYQYVSADRSIEQGERESSSGRTQRPHLRSFALRKLRPEQEASEEAKERASEYGIELQDGYTFVRAYSVGKSLLDDEE